VFDEGPRRVASACPRVSTACPSSMTPLLESET
jgi:hypothetical protein